MFLELIFDIIIWNVSWSLYALLLIILLYLLELYLLTIFILSCFTPLGQLYLATFILSWGEDELNRVCVQQTGHPAPHLSSCFEISFFERKLFLPITAMLWIVRKYKVFVLLILWTWSDLLVHGVHTRGSVMLASSLPIRKINIKPSLPTGTELWWGSK